jgi:hypothetical protein
MAPERSFSCLEGTQCRCDIRSELWVLSLEQRGGLRYERALLEPGVNAAVVVRVFPIVRYEALRLLRPRPVELRVRVVFIVHQEPKVRNTRCVLRHLHQQSLEPLHRSGALRAPT